MSLRMPGVVALIGSLAVAACASDGGSLEDAVSPPSDSASLPAGSIPLPRPAPKYSAAQSIVSQDAHSTVLQDVWRHVPEPVSFHQFNQDKANCIRMGDGAPGAGSPEMKFYLVFNNCMRSLGYESGANAVPRPPSNENGNKTEKGEHNAQNPARDGYPAV
jgi:hypothetical protein